MLVKDTNGNMGDLRIEVNSVGNLYEWSLKIKGKRSTSNEQGKVYWSDWLRREGLDAHLVKEN